MAHLIQRLADGDVVLQPLEAKHAADYIQLANEGSIGWRVNNPQPFAQENFETVLKNCEGDDHFVWMIEFQGNICGAINGASLRKTPVFQGGYWITPAYQKRGIATTALTLVKDFLLQSTQAERLQAVVEPDNLASIRVLEKVGYQCEGLLRRYYSSRLRGLLDVYMYSVIKDEKAKGVAT
jgi:RimJ/RimL family protein N-acetyltransferase